MNDKNALDVCNQTSAEHFKKCIRREYKHMKKTGQTNLGWSQYLHKVCKEYGEHSWNHLSAKFKQKGVTSC